MKFSLHTHARLHTQMPANICLQTRYIQVEGLQLQLDRSVQGKLLRYGLPNHIQMLSRQLIQY